MSALALVGASFLVVPGSVRGDEPPPGARPAAPASPAQRAAAEEAERSQGSAPPPPKNAPLRLVDPLTNLGLGMMAVGAAASVVGLIAIAASPPRLATCNDCGPQNAEFAGSIALGAGLGLIAVGAPEAIVGASGSPPLRTNQRLMLGGALLTGVGVGLVGSGVALIVDDQGRQHGVSSAVPFLVAGGVITVAGVALWAVDGQPAKIHVAASPSGPSVAFGPTSARFTWRF
jgi:hypothetical protein